MSSISERIREIYLESCAKSVAQFARDVGVSQRAMDNYVKGINEPGFKVINLIISRYPQYNATWISTGELPKYNPDYVGNSDNTQWKVDSAANINGSNSSHVTQTISAPHNNDELVNEIKKSREKLIERMIRRIRYTIDRCYTTEEMTEELESLLLDLEIEKR